LNNSIRLNMSRKDFKLQCETLRRNDLVSRAPEIGTNLLYALIDDPLPCPFCGDDEISLQDCEGDFWLDCRNKCNFVFKSEQDAMLAWNRRSER